MTGSTLSGAPVVVATKAQHNGVSHNHNDVGGFVLHVDGETFICDPGRGKYDQYKIYGRYNVPFAGSYGHSVPRIGRNQQSAGREFEGEITAYDTTGPEKRVEIDFGNVYEVPGLEKAHRSLQLTTEGEMIVMDTFRFSDGALPVEEAFVTWLNTTVDGNKALLVGEKNRLELTIESPDEAAFKLEVLKEESEANRKEVPLKRLAFVIEPADREMVARVRARVLPA